MIKTGRVVRIFDDEKIVVNLGGDDGITSDTRILVFAPPVEIEDPETGDNLGTYRHRKASGRVLQVADRFAVIGPYPRRETVQEPAFNYLLRATSGTTKSVPGEFDINEADAVPLPTGNEIRIGDMAIAEVEDDDRAAETETQEAIPGEG